MVEKIALEDEGVKAEIAKLNLPEGTVLISDPWGYGTVTRTLWKVVAHKAHRLGRDRR